MIGRFVLAAIGLMLAAITLKRIFDELRRPARVSSDEESSSPRAVTQLEQDPRTGIYRPAD